MPGRDSFDETVGRLAISRLFGEAKQVLWTGDVLASFSESDQIDRLAGDIEQRCDFSMQVPLGRSQQGQDLADLIVRQLSLTAVLALLPPFLAPHIRNVLGVGAKPKVAEQRSSDAVDDINPRLVVLGAAGIVAGMACLHAGWQRSTHRLFQGHARSAKVLQPGTIAPVQRKDRSSVAVGAPCPLPTSEGILDNVSSQRLERRFSASNTHAGPGTGAPSSIPNARGDGVEDFPTYRTGTLNGHRDHSSVSPRPIASRTGVSCVNCTSSFRARVA